MVQGPAFIYFLHIDDKFYYVDEYRNVLQTANPTPLTFTPDGWQEVSIITERNKKYFGMDRTFTLPLTFVEDGAGILKKIYYSKSVNGKLKLSIADQKLYLETNIYGFGNYYFYYDKFYNGDVDFLTFSHDGPKVSARVIEGGLSKVVKARENTTVEIDVDVPEAVLIKMDGLLFKNNSLYKVLSGPYLGSGLVQHKVPIAFISKESFSVGVSNNSQSTINASTGNILINGGSDYVANISGSVKFQIQYAAFKYTLSIRMKKADNSIEVLYNQQIDTLLNTDYTISFNISPTIPTGATVYIDGLYLSNASPGNLQNMKMVYYETDITVKDSTKYRTTNIKALPVLYVFQQITKKISNSAYTATSELLAASKIMITCGDAIRGLSGSKIRTSLTQFFNSMNAVLNVGMAPVNDVLKMEPKAYWFGGDIIDLGEVSKLRIVPASDYIYNKIMAGYPPQDYGEVNGRGEPNSTLQFTNDIDVKAADYDIVSDYRGDMTGIELTRQNLTGKTTTDSSSDNDTFMIAAGNIGEGSVYELDRSLNPGATGLIDAASAFNLPISPKRMLNNHGWFIRSFLDKMDGTWLKFQTADKNADMIAGGIIEKADVLVSTLAPRLFLPTLFEFETRVPDDYQTLLDANPIRKYRFTYNGITLMGIALKSGIEPSTRKTQIFTLLADASCDLSQLENMYE